MRKKAIGLFLALALCVSPCAAFSDVSDSGLNQTATVLNALGIMQGVGDGRFAPSSVLTRAQFCKLAVTAMGISDVSAYSSYTIFPDVRHSHWAAPYINAAVRHPDIKSLSIIRGYADGTFGPDKTVTFGEACTMLLRMLGYTETDIGPFWPADYVARAKSLGLTDGVSAQNAKAALSRADAARMLLNTLGAEPKEGNKLLSKVASGTVEDSILLATSDTSSSLRASEALFFEDGAVVTRSTVGTLDRSMIGISGTVVLDKTVKSSAVGIVPNHYKSETVTVKNAAADGITTDSGTIRPDRNTPLYTDGTELSGKYAEAWANISAGATLRLYYNAGGQLTLLAVLPTVSSASGNTFVYGVAGAATIPENYKIVKNGATINRGMLKQYDVVTLDAGAQTARVSDTKVTGVYTQGTPSFRYPQTATVLGKSFAVSDRAAATFDNLKLNDSITLLLDENNAVVAAYPRKTVSAEMTGVVTGVGEKEGIVTLTSGLTLPLDAATVSKLQQQYVKLSQAASGDISIQKASLPAKGSSVWTVSSGMIGSSPVSSRVLVFEGPQEANYWNRISMGDLTGMQIPASSIRGLARDSSGSIIAVFLSDTTGKSWLYGVGSALTEKDEDGKTQTVGAVLTHCSGSNIVKNRYAATGLANQNPVAVFVGQENKGAAAILVTKKLISVGTVSLSAFSGNTSVNTANGIYPIDENCGAFVTARNEMLLLTNAKINYTSFRLYADKPASEGGKIRVIIAS